MAENMAGMLAYFTIIPAIIFLLIEPYNRNRFVRFHSFQCLFTAVALIVVDIALAIVSSILHFIPFLGGSSRQSSGRSMASPLWRCGCCWS